jgi:hypothetical protein
MLQVAKSKDQISQNNKEELVSCFCCEKKFKAGKNQHLIFAMCPVCRKYKEEFEKVNYGFSLF